MKVRTASTPVPASGKKAALSFDDKVNRFGALHGDIDSVTSEYNAEIEAVRKKYEPRITPLKEEYDQLKADITADALAKREKIFKGARSLRIGRVCLSFRNGTPALDVVKGTSWKDALNKALKTKEADPYIVRKPELDKTGLKKLWSDVKGQKLLSKLGLTVKTEEKFNIDVDKEEVK